MAMLAVTVLWIVLGQTAFFVGPSEWDDNLYCDMAAIPRGYFEMANRYVHIWSLRIFYLAIESRRDAAAWYSSLVVVGMSWVGFLLGRRVSGTASGLLSAAIMPLYPALLTYFTVPYPDPPMTLWSGLGLVCALAAADSGPERKRLLGLLGSGLFCFFAVKSKETGLSVLPAVAAALWPGERKLRSALIWVSGAMIGWLILSFADWSFLNDFWWSWRPSNYFPKPGANGGGATRRDEFDYPEILLSAAFMAYTLLGTAGAVSGFRERPAVRATAIWAFAALLFSTLICCRYGGIQALARYCVVIGVPLVVLSAYWVTTVWRREPIVEQGFSIGWGVVVVLTYGIAAYGLVLELVGKAGSYTSRFAPFMMPVALGMLFLTPWLGGRGWARISLVLMLAGAAGMSVRQASKYIESERGRLEPWLTLTSALDTTGAQLACWELPDKPYSAMRIERRYRSLSRRPPREIDVREIKSVEEIKENEWLVSTPDSNSTLRRLGWRPFVWGAEQGGAFVVYRRLKGPER